MKSGSVGIKGQFTVLKAALEDLSNFYKLLRGAQMFLSFFIIPQQRVFRAPEAHMRVFIG